MPRRPKPHPGGRPPLPPGEARKLILRVRVTSDEHKVLKARAERETGGDVSALVRAALGLTGER